MSAHVSLSSFGISRHSPMLYETTNRIAASTASGMYWASGAANSRIAEQRERMDHAGDGRLGARADIGRGAGDGARGRQPAEERRETIFAMPWPISSTFGLCLSPLMRSATTADNSDSIAPSMATVKAGGEQRARSCPGGTAAARMTASPLGMPPKRVPMVSTGNLQRPTSAVPRQARRYEPGTRCT